jgi:hypothetical protein
VSCWYEVAAAPFAARAAGAGTPVTSSCRRTDGCSTATGGRSAVNAGIGAGASASSAVVSPISSTAVTPKASMTVPALAPSTSSVPTDAPGRRSANSAAEPAPAGRVRRRPK